MLLTLFIGIIGQRNSSKHWREIIKTITNNKKRNYEYI